MASESDSSRFDKDMRKFIFFLFSFFLLVPSLVYPCAAPDLIFPVDSAFIGPLTEVTVLWEDVTGQCGEEPFWTYQLHVYNPATEMMICERDLLPNQAACTGTQCSFLVTEANCSYPLEADNTYTWSVTAVWDSGPYDSPTWSFTTSDEPVVPDYDKIVSFLIGGIVGLAFALAYNSKV